MAVKAGDLISVSKINGHTIKPVSSTVVGFNPNGKSFEIDPPITVNFNTLYGSGFPIEHKFVAVDNPAVDEYEVVTEEV